MKKKYVILGSNGFVGRNLVKRLEKQVVRLIPRDMYGNFYALKEYIEAVDPDYIINCAAYGNMSHQKDINAIYEVNVINPLRLLEATKDINYKSLILIGSSSEYGPKDEPMIELDKCETNTFYGASKVAQTYLAKAFKDQYKKPITVVRPFSIYGPGEADFRFIPTIIRSIKTGEEFNLVKEPSHDWIHIDDFINGLMIAMKEKPEVLNIGTGKQHSNIEVVEMLEEIAKMKANYNEVKQLRGFDSNYWVADNSLLKYYGWHQEHSLLEGLKDCYEKYW